MNFFYSDKTPTIDDFNKKNTLNSIEFELEVKLDSLDKERIESKAVNQKRKLQKNIFVKII
ncbi:hypothetical protein OS31_31910 [Dickeya oryzae]